MKGIIIYKTIYGSTKQYAKWLEQATGFKAFSVKGRFKKALQQADIVIFGSLVVASMPMIAPYIKKNWEKIKNKKIILYTTSGAPPTDQDLKKGFEKAFPEDMRKKIHYFPLGGRTIIEKLKWHHKLMIKMAAKMVKDPKQKEQMTKDVDRVEKKSLEPIIELVNNLKK
ncbi:MAG: hypothetical protein GF332_04055 [Candidatus Moranbacteria bacterium]|nr:hypothetical protein [Candidatus Moranbacteria bacterium]